MEGNRKPEKGDREPENIMQGDREPEKG